MDVWVARVPEFFPGDLFCEAQEDENPRCPNGPRHNHL